MSVKVSSWVWHGDECAELAGNEMILLLALADVADDNGRCRFMTEDDDLSYAGLARKARVSRSTVIRIMAKLREAGLVEQVAGVKGRPNDIGILVPWALKSGSNLEPKQDSVSTANDSVSTATLFGSTADVGSSLIRIDVEDVVHDDGFADFWAVWPRKDAKKKAAEAWARAVKKAPAEVILSAARGYAESPHRPERQYVPYGATWLNGEQWNDPLPEPRGGRLSALDRGRQVDALLSEPHLRALQ